MKCRICSFEIPEGKKSCPKCGRVVTAADKQRSEQNSTVSDKTMVYRPASFNSSPASGDTIHIGNLFSSDPNAPKYSDPHAYDKATADALEYDKMFMSKSSANDRNEYESRNTYERTEKEITDDTIYYGNNYEEDEYIEEEPKTTRGAVIRDKKQAKPHLNFNAKYLVIAIAFILGLVVIVTGAYQIANKIGLLSEQNEAESVASGQSAENPKKSDEEKTEEDIAYTYQTGVYTVYSDDSNIFIYKSSTDQRIIATIPNKTIIEISAIEGNFGKTLYNDYVGWVRLDELKFTPNEVSEHTTAAPTTEASSDTTSASPSTPGTYTIHLTDGSTHLNVRSIGSTDGEIITTLANGTEVYVEEVKSGWGKIFIEDIEGWIYLKYVR